MYKHISPLTHTHARIHAHTQLLAIKNVLGLGKLLLISMVHMPVGTFEIVTFGFSARLYLHPVHLHICLLL